MQPEVTEFIVIAPSSMGKAVEYAEQRILERLTRSFPGCSFQIEPYGPLATEDEFGVIPIMGKVGGEVSQLAPSENLLDRYPPKWLLGAIKDVLREFELTPGLH